ncbi:hypothetical protein FBUS_01156 [Fasciolopsis buskii]|uniref:Uncharacterized protein n=1 Tax=Fasciolopsis buskii TaxID=27845 RepID=A0A8E0RM62_9TREM|nr:hypothetical protein FBUS_01156 [Fasciolopsis buski]
MQNSQATNEPSKSQFAEAQSSFIPTARQQLSMTSLANDHLPVYFNQFDQYDSESTTKTKKPNFKSAFLSPAALDVELTESNRQKQVLVHHLGRKNMVPILPGNWHRDSTECQEFCRYSNTLNPHYQESVRARGSDSEVRSICLEARQKVERIPVYGTLPGTVSTLGTQNPYYANSGCMTFTLSRQTQPSRNSTVVKGKPLRFSGADSQCNVDAL